MCFVTLHGRQGVARNTFFSMKNYCASYKMYFGQLLNPPPPPPKTKIDYVRFLDISAIALLETWNGGGNQITHENPRPATSH